MRPITPTQLEIAARSGITHATVMTDRLMRNDPLFSDDDYRQARILMLESVIRQAQNALAAVRSVP